ncbi:MAG: DNA/RNA nuclease SfsA [Holosporales bacterium]|nr:DNA/RNA nuclease SfsA [Holosporales bacterium]
MSSMIYLNFETTLSTGILCRRYKRFIADIEQEDGSPLTIHCPNTGAMRGLTTPGTKIFFSHHPHSNRKYPYTWQAVSQEDTFIGVNTHLPNRLVAHTLSLSPLLEVGSYQTLRREVPYGQGSKVDFLLQSPGKADCYLEVKNVHFKEGEAAFFPDTPTTRGQKHMRELADQVRRGNRAIVLYVIQREDVTSFSLGEQFDPVYAKEAQEAFNAGVEMIAYTCSLDRKGISLKKSVPFLYNAFKNF